MRSIASRLTILLCAPSQGLAHRSYTLRPDLCPLRPAQLLYRSICPAPLFLRLPSVATMSSAAQIQPEGVPEAAGPEPPAPIPGPDAEKVIDECTKGKGKQTADAGSESKSEGSEAAAEPQLPPLSPADFRTYNRLAQQMDYFVSHNPVILTSCHVPMRLLQCNTS